MSFKINFETIKIGVFLISMVTISVFFAVIFEEIKIINEPSAELVSKVEEKYLVENLKNDFGALDSFITNECEGLIIKNPQGIIIDKMYINFNREVTIPVIKLSESQRNLIEGIYNGAKDKCVLNKELKK